MGRAADTAAMSMLGDCEISEQFDLEYLPCFFLQAGHHDIVKIMCLQKEWNEQNTDGIFLCSALSNESPFCELIPF